MKSGQKGFTIVETLLLLILLAILGFTGYYVWHSQKQTDKTLNTASNEQLAAPDKKSKTNKPTSTQVTTAAAEKIVEDFYSAYIQAQQQNSTAGNQDASLAVVAKYGTTNFINSYPTIQKTKDMDPVFCAQNTVQSISILSSSTDSSGDIVVNISRQDYGDTANSHPSVTVIGGKVDSVTCPST